MTREPDDFAEEEEEFRRALDSIPPPTPPDGGWGWVVVFASFCINMIVDGICYSYGVLLPELKLHFGESLAKMSLGGSLLLGMYMMSSPVTCALCNRFGSRKVAMFGCLVSFISLLASLAADESTVFVVLYGCCGGIGFGLTFLAAVLGLGFYFEKNRSLAATIAMCGSSLGMALLAPLTRTLLVEYGLYGTITWLVGIALQGFILAALLRPIDSDLRRRKKMVLKRMEEDKKIGPQTCIIMQRLLEEKKRQRMISTGSLNNGVLTKDNILIKAKDFSRFNLLSRSRFSSFRSNNSILRSGPLTTPKLPRASSPIGNPSVTFSESSPSPSNQSSPIPVRSQTVSPSNELLKQVLLSNITKNYSSKSLQLMSSGQAGNVENGSKDFQSLQDMPINEPTQSHENLIRSFVKGLPAVDRPMYRKDILYSGSVQHLQQYQENRDAYSSFVTSVPGDLSHRARDCWERVHFLPQSVTDVLKCIFSTDTCKSPTFLLLAFSSCLTMFGYYIPFLLLPFYASSRPNSDSMLSALLLTILGSANTVGRIIAGVIGTKSWVDPLVLNNIALLIAGGLTMALPFCETFILQSLFAVIFGLCVSAYSSLRSILVVELIGLEKLTTCFNQLYILHGFSILIGTPLSCSFYDSRREFDVTFYVAGGAIFISGLLSLPLRKISEYEKKQRGIQPSISSSEEDLKKASLIKNQAIEMVAM